MMTARLLLSITAMTMVSCASVSLRHDFEGAHVGTVRQISDTEFECALDGQSDQDGRNRQVTWYYFRLDGAKGKTVTIRLSKLRGEYNYKRGGIAINGEAPPVISTDGRHWQHIQKMDFDKDKEVASFQVTPTTDRLWVAHIEPYTWLPRSDSEVLYLSEAQLRPWVIRRLLNDKSLE